uniref:Beta-hexosaminidase A n=1 Tax=Panagrellus redivivus TaxID=6233 RepID=A0A7E4VKU6_PANRE
MWWLRPADIIDEPRFPWRGVMLDTARHFLTVGMIKQQLDLMAQNKFNVFHWHIVDHEAFPYTSTRFPELTKGAYTPKHVYTVEEIKGIVEFARLRGIRVVVEFDTPGHTASWRAGAPAGVIADCYTDATDSKIMPFAGLLDPTQNITLQFLKEFLEEAQGVFPDDYIHLGGEEVDEFLTPCWLNNKGFMERMRTLKFGNSTDKLQQAFFQTLIEIITHKKPEKRAVLWEEAFYSSAAPKNSIAQVWRGWQNQKTISETLEKVTAAGHQAILSSCWYLNYISYGPDWQYLYNCEPHNFNGTDEQKDLVIGGEAAFWGEYVDGASLTPLMWPRASAVAERLWSDPAATKNADDAWPRLHEHRCRLLLRGYAVQPPNTPDYCLDPWDPPYPQY